MVYVPNPETDLLRQMATVSHMANENNRLQLNFQQIMQQNYDRLRQAGLNKEASMAMNAAMGQGWLDKPLLDPNALGKSFSDIDLPKWSQDIIKNEEIGKLSAPVPTGSMSMIEGRKEWTKKAIEQEAKDLGLKRGSGAQTLGDISDKLNYVDLSESMKGTQKSYEDVVKELGTRPVSYTEEEIKKLGPNRAMLMNKREKEQYDYDEKLAVAKLRTSTAEGFRVAKEEEDVRRQEEYNAKIKEIMASEPKLKGDANVQFLELRRLAKKAINNSLANKDVEGAREIYSDVVSRAMELDRRWGGNRARAMGDLEPPRGTGAPAGGKYKRFMVVNRETQQDIGPVWIREGQDYSDAKVQSQVQKIVDVHNQNNPGQKLAMGDVTAKFMSGQSEFMKDKREERMENKAFAKNSTGDKNEKETAAIIQEAKDRNLPVIIRYGDFRNTVRVGTRGTFKDSVFDAQSRKAFAKIIKGDEQWE